MGNTVDSASRPGCTDLESTRPVCTFRSGVPFLFFTHRHDPRNPPSLVEESEDCSYFLSFLCSSRPQSVPDLTDDS